MGSTSAIGRAVAEPKREIARGKRPVTLTTAPANPRFREKEGLLTFPRIPSMV